MVNTKIYSWITAGSQRIAVLKAFGHMMTPAQIHKKSKHFNEKVSMNNASDVLRSFARKGVAVCLNEDAKIGRLYKLTAAGERLRNELLRE
jgi:hypothetical protein